MSEFPAMGTSDGRCSAFPHRADLSSVPAEFEAVHRAIEVGLAALPGMADRKESARHRAFLAEQFTLRACLSHARGGEAAPDLRESLRLFCEAVEGGHPPGPWDLWNFSLAALATGDRRSLGFLMSVPDSRWIEPGNRTLLWLALQVLSLWALATGNARKRAGPFP